MDNKIAAYLSELYRWNKKINLTAVANVDAEKLLVEPSFAMMEFIPGRAKVFDIGSGGGIPSIVLAIKMPDCEFTLLESDGKKAVFLAQVAALLKLSNVTVVRERAEKAAITPKYSGKGDVVTSRAVRSDVVFSAGNGFLRQGGRVILHRSSKENLADPRFELFGKNRFAECFTLIKKDK
jgi:16S rRNA (guanine527-N7)-methyltransferase